MSGRFGSFSACRLKLVDVRFQEKQSLSDNSSTSRRRNRPTGFSAALPPNTPRVPQTTHLRENLDRVTTPPLATPVHHRRRRRCKSVRAEFSKELSGSVRVRIRFGRSEFVAGAGSSLNQAHKFVPSFDQPNCVVSG